MIFKNKKELLKKHKSLGNIKVINIPKKDEKLAELVGIILGDGNIHIYCKNKKNGMYMLRIAANYLKDYEYLTKYVSKLCENLFSIKTRTYKIPNVNCIYLIAQGRLLIDFLIDIGLKPNNKIKSQVTIPKWIWKNENYLRACIRGLIDTDGCIYEMTPHWPGLFQLNFENRNIALLKDVRKALIKLGYSTSKICGNRTPNGTKIYISKKDEIKKFYKEIGFSNQRLVNQVMKLFNS